MRSLAAALPHDDLESHRRALLDCERRGGDVLALCADLAARGWWRPVWERAERLVCSSSWTEEERRTVVRVDSHHVVIDDIEPVLAGVVIDASGRPRADAQVGLTIGHGGAQVKPGDVIVISATRTDPALAREAANTVRLLAPYAAGECAGCYPPCECPVCYPRTQRSDDPGPPIPLRAVERLYLRAVDVWWPYHGREWLALQAAWKGRDQAPPDRPCLPELPDQAKLVQIRRLLQEGGYSIGFSGGESVGELIQRVAFDAMLAASREYQAVRTTHGDALDALECVFAAIRERQERAANPAPPRTPIQQAQESVEHLRGLQRRRGRW